MTMVGKSVREARQRWFRRLDLAFWAIWAALPVMVWLAYRANTTASAAIAASLSPDQAPCAGIVANPLHMSLPGKLLFWTLFTLQLSFFAVLIGILHRMVHRFARGRIFVSETLQGVWWMAIILVIWPFVDVITSNAVAYALYEIGDVKFHLPTYNIDVGTIAGGVFLMALKFVIEQAILLQSENELTI
ncbi:DUF2975 domain-containing protein [Bradyrhizobium hipponense]|uniref:DUF2975 domain-containing protein n=1 Tax=Bradyrhizobium hipponense TaxID=2605638 RepID=A0A5S4YN51_9BRAD|nr:DUF2975 domain-containing protein [Bradyrhizobium hipponense]TYO65851.1 DUF2975 domain-containing protein [Bradyrhizobium hipponense]